MNHALAFYRGKKVFITGDTGFKGSWLSMLMLNLGAEIRGYGLPPSLVGATTRNWKLANYSIMLMVILEI